MSKDKKTYLAHNKSSHGAVAIAKIVIYFLATLAFIVIAGVTYCYYHNFHSVIPDQVYRSRQLSEQNFIKVIQHYHIKTVINLRGAHPGIKWYDDEMSAIKQTNIAHYDFALQSKTLPDLSTLQRLVKTIAYSSKPLLVHCESGVDRSGLAAVIALILNNEPSLATIEKQESIRYFVLSDNSVGKQFLRRYIDWLQKNNLTNSRKNLLRWLHL